MCSVFNRPFLFLNKLKVFFGFYSLLSSDTDFFYMCLRQRWREEVEMGLDKAATGLCIHPCMKPFPQGTRSVLLGMCE